MLLLSVIQMQETMLMEEVVLLIIEDLYIKLSAQVAVGKIVSQQLQEPILQIITPRIAITLFLNLI